MRQKRNRSGSVSVHVIDKTAGFKVVATLGSSRDPDEIQEKVRQAERIVREYMADKQQGRLLPLHTPAERAIDQFMATLSNANIRTVGPELIFGALFDRMGFNAIPDTFFRHLVIARLVWPLSKLKTVDYLERYNGTVMTVEAVYKFMDRLHSRYKSQAEQIAYAHTKQRLTNISVVFYDMTTLYFEAEQEDDLRKIGMSKDGKFQQPQIMLGLLVGPGGLPIGYDIFTGNTFEGHTLLPTLSSIQKKYGFKQPIVIADAAMLSKDNLANLQEARYQFIIGGRIKNEPDKIKQQILAQSTDMANGDSITLKRMDGTRLIVTYSDKRARKDAHNRERGLARLQKRMKSGKLTKASLNNRGYNKFLTLKGEVALSLDEERVKADEQWDGLKGYITNTKLEAAQVVAHYGHLWRIEKAFRISKTDLRIRPIYHRKKRRIEAHLCIAFVAYAIYRELELLLQSNGITMTGKRAAELTHTMYAVEYALPDSPERQQQLLRLNDEQESLRTAVHG